MIGVDISEFSTFMIIGMVKARLDVYYVKAHYNVAHGIYINI